MKISRKIKSFQLFRGQTTVKQIIFIIIAVLLFIGLALAGGWLVNKQIQQTRQSVPLSVLLEKENKKIEMPIGFPKNLPLLEPNNVSQAYFRDQETKDITITIESKKSVKENYGFYLDYGKDNNWQIDEARPGTDKLPGKLLLRKDKLILSFSFKDKEKGGAEIIISSTRFNLPRFLGPPLPANENEEKIPETGAGPTNPFLNQPKPKEEKIPAKAGQLPEGFPESFPLNGQTEITEAYTLKVENQAGAAYVIKFKSDQAKETNINFYQDWFKSNNWFLGEQKSEGSATLITASKPFVNSVEVSIVPAPDSTSEVEIRWREFR